MQKNGRLKIILQQNNADKKIERMFHESSLKSSRFGKQFKELLAKKDDIKNAFVNAFPHLGSIIDKVLQNDFELFLNPERMPWYLDIIAQRIIDNKGTYHIHYKACRDFSYFDVSSAKGKMLLSPFFHKAPSDIISGLADTLLFLAPNLSDITKPFDADIIKDAIDWFSLDLHTEPVKLLKRLRSLTQYELNVHATVDWDSSDVKEKKKSIKIYKSDGKEKKEKEVIVSSKNIREAIGHLSEAWHNPSSSSIVLCAGTGSGKDVLQDVLTYALSVNNVKTIPFAAPKLTTRQIFHELLQDKFISKERGSKEYNFKYMPLLFLDEIHHPSAQDLREELLRVLETKEINVDGARVNCAGVRYLFAASQLPAKLRTHYPPDFWTRIEYTVVMRHPLDLESRNEINETLQQFFCKFWREAAEKQRERIAKDQPKRRRPRTTTDQMSEILNSLCPKSGDEATLEVLAEAFAVALDSPLIPLISVRQLRSIVNRLFSRAVYFVQTTKVENSQTIKSVEEKLDRWIIDIFKEIVPEMRPDGMF
jgi:hypothetical protein